eukprot:11211462-Lingulodinium_polyedra.AAC.1
MRQTHAPDRAEIGPAARGSHPLEANHPLYTGNNAPSLAGHCRNIITNNSGAKCYNESPPLQARPAPP